MEELRKLEQVQETLSFMQSRGVVVSSSDNNDDSNRFLANLILLLVVNFLPALALPSACFCCFPFILKENLTDFHALKVQPSGKLDMAEKCSLILEYVPKLSASFLEEALPRLSQEGTQVNCFRSGIVNENDCGEALVGLDGMQRANSTLEDFSFLFYLLSTVVVFLVQLDSLNEKIVNMPTDGVTVSERGFEEKAYEKQVSKLIDILKSDPFRPLVSLLERHGLLTERIVEEFRCGEEYWALERKLCCALMTKKEISVEDVMRAIHLKSFDYRVLNLILYQLRGEEVNNLHMEFLSISEFLVEISDDLFDYEDDVLENNFNILRMFVRIYGPATAPTMIAKYITESEEKYNRLLKSLDPQLSSNYQRRCEEATKEGGKITGHPLGTWSIPPLIVDEESYRYNLLNMK
ncbi:ATP synthase subunit b [Citrus sinensis]|uniref:ATP synthase subunit b n=1 Tax=Citrus sinensis TaxID=2711 RepID=A0ACB8J604_CITSI|nr:ATP synthase subunit b [Citrus sinensis]